MLCPGENDALPRSRYCRLSPTRNRLAVAACFSRSLQVILMVLVNMRTSIAHRYWSLLEVNEVALTTSTTENIFQGMCMALKDIVPYDRAGLTLYDPDHDSLRIAGTFGPHESSIFRVGHLLSRTTSQTGWVFEHKTALFRRDLEKESRFPGDKKVVDEGYRSICSVPLVVRGSSIGVVSVLGSRKNQLSADHAEIVEEMSKPIALAISSLILRCPKHTNTRVVCPRCIGAAGGCGFRKFWHAFSGNSGTLCRRRPYLIQL
jgi:transcriptional regulator with GAF, ATPase, and Fis domain